MAKSKYEYVKQFELEDKILPNCWLVVRLDGRGFTRFTKEHNFRKPNDKRGLDLMNRCAQACFQEMQDVVLAFGESDEYSFVLDKQSNLFTRRSSKLVSVFASYFAANFVFYWPQYFPDLKLQYPPTFDARVVAYPTIENLRDYLAWRQADTHINNLYNTCFWMLVEKDKKTEIEAEKELKGTFSNQKNELLFSRFGINYNQEPEMFRKGSVILRKQIETTSEKQEETNEANTTSSKNPHHNSEPSKKWKIVVCHEDIIGDTFWKQNPHILKQNSNSSTNTAIDSESNKHEKKKKKNKDEKTEK